MKTHLKTFDEIIEGPVLSPFSSPDANDMSLLMLMLDDVSSELVLVVLLPLDCQSREGSGGVNARTCGVSREQAESENCQVIFSAGVTTST